MPLVNMVLIMTVVPGKGGQKLIPECLIKEKEIKDYIDENNLDTFVEVDGGVNKETIEDVRKTNIDIAVAGSAIINAEDFKKAINELKY